MPAFYRHLQGTRVDWNYYAEESRSACLGLKRGSRWHAGKGLGGSSGINAMLYIRGNRRDYDRWAELGNEGWQGEKVLEYFKKSQDNRVEHVADNRVHHAIDGPLKVDSFSSIMMIKMILAEAVFELGYKEIFDCNADEHIGFITVQGTIDRGSRCSTAKAFLQVANDRPNIRIIKNAHVTNLEFRKNGSVKGVQFKIGNKILHATTKKEVILSAGALSTPKLLMLSGIGPHHQLAKHNITVRHELPVGFNLQDHLSVPYAMAFHRSNAMPLNVKDFADAVYQYSTYQVGLLATIGASDFMGFVSTVNDTQYPNIQYLVYHFHKNSPDLRLMFENYGYKDEIVESFVRANTKAELVVWAVTLLKPKSRGKIVLSSSDPMDPPKIYHNYLMERVDLETTVKGLNILRNISTTNTFAIHEGEVVHVTLPDCDKFDRESDKYWQCYVRHMGTTSHNPVGTAKMGPDSDMRAVVDAKLKVKGVRQLRVVDASIMPEIVSGNTNAPTIMIGEMASDFIKAEWEGK